MAEYDQRILRVAAMNGTVAETLDSPAVPEALGKALATVLRANDPDVVAFWSSADTAVLAHVVARELGAELLPVAEDQGRILVGRPIVATARVAVIDIDWTGNLGLAPLARALGGPTVVVAAGSILRPVTPVDEGAEPTLHVLEPAEDSADAAR
ncbi:hypothetical protein [Pseudonocardia alaniniphila]|uniref:Uncharacterized protein n=1 Tax=Pseudonocardia alaniniphila TaxID=75291 RepID=A0ABS9TGI6_9PSEU|nr:hypothetical protein [Pseudonocardia alaniniphila]MCH6167656.1 hypothetical protein [Pseudonocardia alaniniphila]